MDKYEVSLFEAMYTIRLHKKFLAQIRQQTELKQDYGLYRDLLELIIRHYPIYGIYDGICPTMRIALVKDWPYREAFHIQGGRVLFHREKHNVELCISFDLDDFVKYLLLVDEKSLGVYETRAFLNAYSLTLMERIRMEYPKRYLRKKNFTIEYTQDIEAIRVRMAEILSHYMYMMGKSKLRVSRPVRIIEKMYGMPARAKRLPRHRQKYT